MHIWQILKYSINAVLNHAYFVVKYVYFMIKFNDGKITINTSNITNYNKQ